MYQKPQASFPICIPPSPSLSVGSLPVVSCFRWNWNFQVLGLA
jgi:hypothetical protein